MAVYLVSVDLMETSCSYCRFFYPYMQRYAMNERPVALMILLTICLLAKQVFDGIHLIIDNALHILFIGVIHALICRIRTLLKQLSLTKFAPEILFTQLKKLSPCKK